MKKITFTWKYSENSKPEIKTGYKTKRDKSDMIGYIYIQTKEPTGEKNFMGKDICKIYAIKENQIIK